MTRSLLLFYFVKQFCRQCPEDEEETASKQYRKLFRKKNQRTISQASFLRFSTMSSRKKRTKLKIILLGNSGLRLNFCLICFKISLKIQSFHSHLLCRFCFQFSISFSLECNYYYFLNVSSVIFLFSNSLCRVGKTSLTKRYILFIIHIPSYYNSLSLIP